MNDQQINYPLPPAQTYNSWIYQLEETPCKPYKVKFCQPNGQFVTSLVTFENEQSAIDWAKKFIDKNEKISQNKFIKKFNLIDGYPPIVYLLASLSLMSIIVFGIYKLQQSDPQYNCIVSVTVLRERGQPNQTYKTRYNSISLLLTASGLIFKDLKTEESVEINNESYTISKCENS